VQAAWWETAPFRVGLAAVFVLVLMWAVRKIVLLRVRARIRKLEQEHLLERERNRIARDIHDQLGASITQMAITAKMLTLDPPEAVPTHSREITTLTRGMADSLAEIVWAVNPHHDNLGALVEYLAAFAGDFMASAKIECEVDVPADLPARPVSSGVRHHLVLIVKESLNNVVKHSGARKVRLTVTFANQVLGVTVSDDGCGFDPASVSADSNGIRIFGERMKELGGEFRLESARGKGTRVSFTLPLPEAHP
jgi:signal transduction histidine kinase